MVKYSLSDEKIRNFEKHILMKAFFTYGIKYIAYNMSK